MRHTLARVIIPFILLVGCNSNNPDRESTIIRVQYSAATAPWLADITECANQNDVLLNSELRMSNALDIQVTDMVIRIGDRGGNFPTYQIGTDNLLVIVNRQNPSGSLGAERVRALFSGQMQNWKEINGNDAPVQVWVFPTGDDIQQAFQQVVLDGSPVSSNARLAMTPDEMSQAITNDVNAIGFLNRRWKAGNVSDLYTSETLPILAIFPSHPEGVASALLACMQSTQK